jgi:hypothetical protein
LSWAGVGNVDAVVLRRDGRRGAGIAVRGGVVGYQLPPLRAATVDIAPGDVLILATDGIRAGFIESIVPDGVPQNIADSILARWARGSDDARVVVARYFGGPR